MNLFLAGGISGNLSKQLPLLAAKIQEQCTSISQEKTASLIAYYCSQSWDVWVFHKIREKGTGNKWLRNNLSTMTSQIIDTAIFITIAFIGSVPNIWVMIGSQYLIKCIYALLDTIPFYYLTRGSEIINPNK